MDLKKIITWAGFLSLILTSFAIKLIEFDNPFSGFHMVRQLDNMLAIENYFIEGIGLKRLSVAGDYIVFELPIYQVLVAYLASSFDELLLFARSVNLIFALLSMILVFRIANIWFDFKTAIYSTLFFAFAPMNLAYHRSIMMDMLTIFFCLTATWLLLEYFYGKRKSWILPLFLVAGGISVVTKPLYFFPVGVIAVAHYISQYLSPFIDNLIKYIKKNLGLVISFFLLVITLFWWIELARVTNGQEHGMGVTHFSDWSFLFSPKYYALIFFRFSLLLINPFALFFFIVGVVLIWKRDRYKNAISLPILIPLYYIIFGYINFPHEYYSLIIIPYCSLVAGVGAVWFEETLSASKLINKTQWVMGFICILSSMISVLIFFLNFLIASPNLDQKSVQIQKEMEHVLEDKQKSFVYVNKSNFPLVDYIKYNRSLYLSYILGLKSEEEIRTNGLPISTNEVLYALRQFGAVRQIYGGVPQKHIVSMLQDHPDNLRYVMFYRYSNDQTSKIKSIMSEYSAIYESNEWIVFDLKIKISK